MKAHTILSRFKHTHTHWITATSDKFALLFAFLSILTIVLRWRVLPPAVPLWYSHPWGEEQLAHPAWLFLLPISGIAWQAITLLVSATLLREHPLFSRVLFLSSFLVNFLLFLTLVNIVFVVT
ncbi:hypothetical protein A3A64_01870 [Candidatus Gottesmanbacteria bacterium RIFCSPLOWO2_01_FULL_48_11]|uniref:DUF1648 domain-containing protein n=3 Tax=Candidatus Gottesmaniibacteriota TaxID=1752720 RepID=A0A0G1UQ98_9BACT|nr:MAG: hypothetical protein UY16_C0002G0028 [Candidatus Gottesmanbacteria bacterium GW2011_GWA2_47_9]KKU96241.1 MAG: hypothetical protein UY27_C0002G0026 [Candidatus Gottesmanbacteria bacterium GW2011_GWA1_48_13]OGG27534.1 MAG: hypothetical protein A3A64_01870 [Candidatus Gottesmanbacteria bacterium RIFCSPLOWO2_01_FULL_48_11]